MPESSWTEMLWEDIDQEDVDRILTTTARSFERALSEYPRASDDVAAIIDNELSSPLALNSWWDLQESLENYFNNDSGYVFTWVAIGDPRRRLAQFANYADDSVVDFVRRILAIYGRRIGRSVQLSNHGGDDWERVSWVVAYERARDSYRLRLEIAKVQGESSRIEGTPTSLLMLTTQMCQMMLEVDRPEVFEEESADSFKMAAEQVIALLSARTDELSPVAEVETVGIKE